LLTYAFVCLDIYIFVCLDIQGIPNQKLTILNGYNFFNIHGREMKQKLAESWDLNFLLHLSVYLSNNLALATIQFRMRLLNFPMTRCRISRGIDTMICLTWLFIWLIVAGIFSWFNLSYNPKDKNVTDSDLVNVGDKKILTSTRSVSRESDPPTSPSYMNTDSLESGNIGRIFRKDFLKHFDICFFGYRNSHAC